MVGDERARRAARSRLLWSSTAACLWSLVFAVPHFYWAAGGRGGLGAQAAAADEALGQSWFFAYNLVVGVLAVAGAATALVLGGRVGVVRMWRPVRGVAWSASVVLFVRGAVGMVDLGLQFAGGVLDSPPMLVAIEPWFLLGGYLFASLARRAGRERSGADSSPDSDVPAVAPD
ncbi:MAG: DUF3995 domain-containing protein [Euzebyales bacterium]|nr:DUF3995 domain-containing protein [Euzebyales bacterium]